MFEWLKGIWAQIVELFDFTKIYVSNYRKLSQPLVVAYKVSNIISWVSCLGSVVFLILGPAWWVWCFWLAWLSIVASTLAILFVVMAYQYSTPYYG